MPSLTRRPSFVALPTVITLLLLAAAGQAMAQNATVTVSSVKQYIRGFGGINHPVWAGDLTATQRTTAFSNGAGQLGFSVLRMWISDSQNDWPKEVATAKRAQELGAIVFATPWNPPASMTMTVNGAKSINPAQFSAYAGHLNSFISYMKGQGVNVYAVAVQNEPDYAQDWTKWTQTDVYNFVLNHGASITTKLITAESFNYNKSFYDPILNDPNALKNIAIVGTHLYGTAVSGFPYALYDTKAAGKERWMTEHYTDSKNDADLWPMALDVAYELHNSMVEAQFNAYTWWYIRRSYGPMKEDGSISKRGYCMMQWTRFVRPGWHRVDATKNPTSGVYVSAYKDDSDVVVVVVNRNTGTSSVNIAVPNTTSGASWERYTTSASKSFATEPAVKASGTSLTVSMEGSSVTTLRGVGVLGGATGSGGAQGSGGASGSGGATTGAGGAMGSGGVTGSGGAQDAGGETGGGGETGAGGATGATGGATGGGGAVGTGGVVGADGATTEPTDETAGCSCSVKGERSSVLAFIAVFGALAVVSSRRRRRP